MRRILAIRLFCVLFRSSVQYRACVTTTEKGGCFFVEIGFFGKNSFPKALCGRFRRKRILPVFEGSCRSLPLRNSLLRREGKDKNPVATKACNVG